MHPLEYKSTSKSYLYELLSSMGVTQSTETTIRNMRVKSTYIFAPIMNKPIMGRQYHNSHTLLPLKDIDKIELWINGEHLNPDQYTIAPEDYQYITTLVPVVLNRPDATSSKYLINRNIIHREYKTNTTPKDGTYTFQYNFGKGATITEKSVYAIADNKFTSPTEVKITGETITATFRFIRTIDIFLCKNLVWSGEAAEKETILVTDRLDPAIYGTYYVDHFDLAEIDVRFYPFVNVVSGGFLRVFSDVKTVLKQSMLPYIRYINYPEFSHVRDPYDFGWYGSNTKFSGDRIYPTDSDAVIYRKFADIGREYYKVKEYIMPRANLFKVYDSCFAKRTLALEGNRTENILYTSVPFDDYRDILFYEGKVFSDYRVDKLKEINSQYVEINQKALQKYYIIDAPGKKYKVSEFSILKFNTKNNTTIKTISSDATKNPDGKYDYLIEFNKKFQTMYKNFLALQEYRLDLFDENQVVLSEEESDIYRDYTWLQILEMDNLPPNAVRALIKSGIRQNPDDPRVSVWFDTENADPTSLYRRLLVANIEQDPSMVDNILFALPPAKPPEGIFDSFSIGNDQSLSEDEIFFDLGGDGEPFSMSKEVMYEGNIENPYGEPEDIYLQHDRKIDNEDLLSFIEDNQPLMSEILGGEEDYFNIIEKFAIRDMTNDPVLKHLWFAYESKLARRRMSTFGTIGSDPYEPIELLSRIIWLGTAPPELHEDDEGIAVWFSYRDMMTSRTYTQTAETEVFDNNTLSNLYLNRPMTHIPEHTDIFAEWINEPLKKVIMVDKGTIVAAINENIVRINLTSSYESEYLDLFVFDDIVLNFRKNNKTSLSYNGILPDLLNNRIVDESSLIVFDGVMRDRSELGYLDFENTHDAGNVIHNNSWHVNPDELNIIYSNNLKRHTIRREDLSPIDQTELDMNIIPINDDSIYYDGEHVATFANGVYIQANKVTVLTEDHRRLRVVGFDEPIERIDFLYNENDRPIYRLKACLD